MAYTDIDKPSDYFNTVLYTGNGSSNHAITGVGFQPDLNWHKIRNDVDWHMVNDSVRGANYAIYPNATNAEGNVPTGLKSFDSDGFTVGSLPDSNQNNGLFASWNWKAGTSFTNDASGTGIGSIDSAGSVSDVSGFSIVSYTGTGSAGTIKHGLSATANFMIIKNRDAARSWNVYFGDQTKYMYLNDTSAQADAGTIIWNNTAPTSSVFSIGTDNGVNQSGEKYIAYVFSQKQGYSAMGTYVGNSSTNGTFVYTGMKPAWVMFRKAAGTGSWAIQDNKRTPFNVQQKSLFANLVDVETDSANDAVDFLSNGFKFRSDTANYNTNGDTYIFMAFAEESFVSSTGVPATAR
jgi:hypothetical protein